MATKQSEIKFNELNDQLQEILGWFESSDFDIEKAEEKYKLALKIIGQLETKLNKIEIQINKLKS